MARAAVASIAARAGGTMPTRRLPLIALATSLLAAGLLPGCGIIDATREPRGHKVDGELLAQLAPGVQTRADVLALLGSPSATAVFGEETWFYISGVTENRVGRMDALIEQEVVAVHFDRTGTLARVEVIDKSQAKEIAPVARVTPTPGTERSFVGLILGNIGRFAPGGAGRTPGPGPGVP
jgi:outer membrane protein assembly factor BamE (lipoprotein component of BamABCDE complex)